MITAPTVVLSIWALAAQSGVTSSLSLRVSELDRKRQLAVKNKSAWPECVGEQGVNPEQCKDLVESDTVNHAIPDIKVELSTTGDIPPYTSSEVVIFTNYLGEVTGKKHDGIIDAIKINTRGGVFRFGPWDCSGLNASDCCHNVILTDYTYHNNCYITEQRLEVEPHSDTLGGVEYYSYIYNPTSAAYERKSVTIDEMKEAQVAVNDMLNDIHSRVKNILAEGFVTYEDLARLVKDLEFNSRARSFTYRLQVKIYNLYRILKESEGPNGPPLKASAFNELSLILKRIDRTLFLNGRRETPSAFVVIHVNQAGDVVSVPELLYEYHLPAEGNYNDN